MTTGLAPPEDVKVDISPVILKRRRIRVETLDDAWGRFGDFPRREKENSAHKGKRNPTPPPGQRNQRCPTTSKLVHTERPLPFVSPRSRGIHGDFGCAPPLTLDQKHPRKGVASDGIAYFIPANTRGPISHFALALNSPALGSADAILEVSGECAKKLVRRLPGLSRADKDGEVLRHRPTLNCCNNDVLKR